MLSYTEAFHLTYTDPEGNPIQVAEVLSEEEGLVRIEVRAAWVEPAVIVSFELPVPIVTPVPFPGDEGLHGHLIRLPWSITSRFCHPLLICPFAESIATGISAPDPDRKREALACLRTAQPEDWDFQWINWYGRVNRAACQAISKIMWSLQTPSAGLARYHFRRAISNLIAPNDGQIRPTGWQENGANNCTGLPLTDDCLIFRQMFEQRLGYPDVPGNDQVYEQLKMEYVKKVDASCDICWTSKNHTGREIGRVFEGDATSFITGRPMPRLLRGLNPLAQVANPARVWRENRSCAGWLPFENPITPPLKAKGISLPRSSDGERPFNKRITTLTTAIIDIPGFNVFAADGQDVIDYPDRVIEGEEISLDGLLLTKHGQSKMTAKVEVNELETAEEFLPRMEELKELPGFRFTEDPQQVETLTDGTQVFSYQYRYWYEKTVRCRYDKVKCLCGGIKGVARPISRQLHAEINGEMVPIDMVISERTALSKGAKDLFLYPLLAHAGVTEIDPTWTLEQLVSMAEAGLKEKGLPIDGRFPIYTNKRIHFHDGKELPAAEANCLRALGLKVFHRTLRVQIGWGIVGPLPFVRAQETEHRQSSASQGMSLNSHSRVLGGVPIPIEKKTQQQVEKTARFFYDHAPLAMAQSAAMDDDF